MEKIGRIYTEHPTIGVLKMVETLALDGIHANAKRIRRLMRKMNLMAIYPTKCLSTGGNPEYFHPYLLRNLEVTHPNQVWSTDISCIPMQGGFMYLYAVIDVYSRYIVGWRLSNTLSATNELELMEECINKWGAPEIVNSAQGILYTTQKWQDLLEGYGIRISMDGKGRCKGNIWIERFWRTIKQEYIYITPTDSVEELRYGVGKYITYYNAQRPHQ